jgi:HPr kinase/phosphorylase
VADDATKVTLVDNREVVGTSKEVTRNHMEVRGIGIINVAAMFGVRSIRTQKRVDVVVTSRRGRRSRTLTEWGSDDHYVKILGLRFRIMSFRCGRGGTWRG